MSSCTECHGAEGNHHTSMNCPRLKQQTAPTPDTSPEDELFDINIDPLWLILDDFAEDVEALDEENYNEKLSEAMAEAKDRLNRLMLTRERERLVKLKDAQTRMYYPNHVASGGAVPVSEIDQAIAAIDAQLNKEETDGDSN